MKTSVIAKENIARLNTAINYIEEHLSENLSLKIIAEKAHFSPFHFHRMFTLIVGETLHTFINRKRIEKAASFLLYRKEKSSTTIAEEIGFSDVSSFSKSFKKFYGISPHQFKEESPKKFSQILAIKSKNGKVNITFEQYICNINNALNWLKMRTNTSIKQIEKIELAYISHQGKIEAIAEVYDRLVQWAASKGLMNDATKMVTIYHDSPKITDPNNLRMSACIWLNNAIKVDSEVNLRTIKATKCIVSRLEITPHEFQQAWESSFAWMVENGYKKATTDPFEIYHNNAAEHPENKFIVDLCIPVL
ncbi:AraC family transcriptional regulator [Polaribacter litorisediminis]|uniref:AraC family transcriptional regulator n=1 Tax=Polaribacter litorisediminis TaxID=1908341 RepID=UPI001CC11A66|nr:GyrI-like domain-containing protein [Polaribacter litorisediminis]UAM98547.1 AraC family transcriptional regulator [Polaribacter litorisediminis]